MVNIKTLAVSLATVVMMGGMPVTGMTPSASAADAFSQAASVWPEDLLGATNTLVAFRAEITKPRGGAAVFAHYDEGLFHVQLLQRVDNAVKAVRCDCEISERIGLVHPPTAAGEALLAEKLING